MSACRGSFHALASSSGIPCGSEGAQRPFVKPCVVAACGATRAPPRAQQCVRQRRGSVEAILQTDQADPPTRQFPRPQRKRDPMTNPDGASGPYPAALSCLVQAMAPLCHPPACLALGRTRYSICTQKRLDSRRHAATAVDADADIFAGINMGPSISLRNAVGQHVAAFGIAPMKIRNNAAHLLF